MGMAHRNGRVHPVRLLALTSLLLALLSAVAGCGTLPAADQSFLTGSPCEPPCWYDIVPGVSGQSEVLAALEDNPLVEPGTVSVEQTEYSGVPVTLVHWHDRADIINRAYIRDGTVVCVEIMLRYATLPSLLSRLTRRERALTLGQVVEKLGPPESVQAEAWAAEYGGLQVMLHYPARGLRISSSEYPVLRGRLTKDGARIMPDMRVTTIDYYAPASYREALEDAFLLPAESVEDILSNLHAWQGFRSIVPLSE